MDHHNEVDLPTIVQLSRLQFQLMHQFLHAINLYPGQFHVLQFLSHHRGKTSQKQISQHLFIKPSSVNQILVKLEESSYITRVTDEQDKRKINVQLTGEGKKILQTAEMKFKQIQKIMEKNISEQELRTFENIAEKMKQNLLEERKGECPRCH
ncbi:MAG: MarR family transcriptional regulator [Sphaerochaetaceae bacterium]|nr:MarR family transcriptional regulator [Sphaerochaetaceae bacterium]MDC7246771.1 MarR family transcriptional regulator [Sphaerochaetaceae bacterium]